MCTKNKIDFKVPVVCINLDENLEYSRAPRRILQLQMAFLYMYFQLIDCSHRVYRLDAEPSGYKKLIFENMIYVGFLGRRLK